MTDHYPETEKFWVGLAVGMIMAIISWVTLLIVVGAWT